MIWFDVCCHAAKSEFSISTKTATTISAWAWVWVKTEVLLLADEFSLEESHAMRRPIHPHTHLPSWEILKIRHQIQASPPVVSRHIRNTIHVVRGRWKIRASSSEGADKRCCRKSAEGSGTFWDHFFPPRTFEETSLPNSFPSPTRGLPSSPKVYARLTVRFHLRVLWRTASIFTQADRFAPSLSSNSPGLPALPRIWFTKSSGPNEFSRAVGHHVRSFTASISQGSNVGFCHQFAPQAPLRAFTSSCSPSEATHLCYLFLLPSPCPLGSFFF